MSESELEPELAPEREAEPAPEPTWLRLDPRKLLLDPVKTLGQLLVPVLAVLLGFGSRDNPMLSIMLAPAILLGILVLGALPWLTTSYRISPTQFQLRKGWLNKTTSTAPLDRVRSVDLEASLLHRVLGLRKVQIGTGRDEERITLDAVSTDRAGELRELLLLPRTGAPVSEPVTTADEGGTASASDAPPLPLAPAEPEQEQELARIDWTWLRFAPLSLSRLVVVAGAIGVLFQFLDDIPVVGEDDLTAAWRWLTGFAVALVVAVLAVAVVLGWLVISVLGYVVQWWGLRLTRARGALQLTSGLLTTRSITVEERRVRGVLLTEPWLLQLAGGAELSTLATGVGAGGKTRILPPSPVTVARTVGSDVLATHEPLSTPLRAHGPLARRRLHIRHQWDTVALLVGSVVLTFTDWIGFLDWLPLWVPWSLAALSVVASAWIAESAYSHLGHARTAEHLVAGSGDLARVRTVLETDGIIGWVITQNLFQRRLGLADLVATTAAGSEAVQISDLPHEWAVALADACTPGVLTPFLAAPAEAGAGE